MNNQQRTNTMETRFGNLARVVRDWSERAPLATLPVPSWLARQQSREWPSPDRRRRRRRLLGVTAVAAIAVVALTVLRGFGHSDPTLTFVVSEGPAAAATASIAGRVSSGPLPAHLSFSDGSAVVLQPGARGMVVGTTMRGARVRLEAGRAHFAVAHRPRTDWAVEAGPFTVIVHGTVFDVSWSEGTGVLTVDLIAGVVTVEGPAAALKADGGGGRTTLKAGQRLTACASTGEGRISPIDSTPTEIGVRVNGASAGAGGTVASTAPPTTPRTTAAATERETRQRAHTSARVGVAEVSASWPARVASGSFSGIVADADIMGIERCLSQAPVGALGALADAARYVRRTDLAQRALLAERRRFAGSPGAHDAAFLIGRLAQDAAGDAREALRWYDRYLEEGAHGTYAAEALGRKMLALDRLGEVADARSTAQRYLEAFPHGAFANRATRLQQQ